MSDQVVEGGVNGLLKGSENTAAVENRERRASNEVKFEKSDSLIHLVGLPSVENDRESRSNHEHCYSQVSGNVGNFEQIVKAKKQINADLRRHDNADDNSQWNENHRWQRSGDYDDRYGDHLRRYSDRLERRQTGVLDQRRLEEISVKNHHEDKRHDPNGVQKHGVRSHSGKYLDTGQMDDSKGKKTIEC